MHAAAGLPAAGLRTVTRAPGVAGLGAISGARGGHMAGTVAGGPQVIAFSVYLDGAYSDVAVGALTLLKKGALDAYLIARLEIGIYPAVAGDPGRIGLPVNTKYRVSVYLVVCAGQGRNLAVRGLSGTLLCRAEARRRGGGFLGACGKGADTDHHKNQYKSGAFHLSIPP